MKKSILIKDVKPGKDTQYKTNYYTYIFVDNTQKYDLNLIDIGHEYCKKDKALENTRNYAHRFFTLYFVKSGKGYIRTENNVTAVTSDTVFVFFPECQYTYYPDPVTPWEYYWVNFDGVFAENILQDMNITPDKNLFILQGTEQIEQAFSLLLNGGGDKRGKITPCNLLIYSQFYYLLHCVNLKTNPLFVSPKKKTKEHFLYQAINIINNNFSNPFLSSNAIADSLFISKSYFSVMFNSTFHISFNNYLNQLRLEKAKDLLNNTDYSIKEISNMVGFKDSLYFSKKFKSCFQMSPNAYRKRKS